MSIYSVQGKIFSKNYPYLSIKDVFDLCKIGDFKKLDLEFRANLKKKFPSFFENKNLLKEDINFHLTTIRLDMEDADFFQALFLPFDFYRFLIIKNKQDPKVYLGYFSNEDLSRIISTNRTPNIMNDEIKKIFLNNLSNETKENIKFLERDQILFTQKKIFNRKSLNLVSLYLETEHNFGKILRFLNIESPKDEYDLEIIKFYLPFFFRRKFLFYSNPFEFVFFYLKEKFIIWKIFDPFVF